MGKQRDWGGWLWVGLNPKFVESSEKVGMGPGWLAVEWRLGAGGGRTSPGQMRKEVEGFPATVPMTMTTTQP